MTQSAATARVTGRVQGVWFRGWTRATARELGLTGWVQNEPDGSVTCYFAGDTASIDQMIRALYHGPDHARVDTVVTTPAAPADAPASFEIRR